MDTSYTHRLDAVIELGYHFPGFVSPVGFAHRSLGFFAAIYLQTKWQLDSGRDRLPIWYLVNHSLTLAPSAYAKEYLSNPDEPYEDSDFVKKNPTRDPSHAPITQLETCRAWKEYFRKSALGLSSLRLLWRSHTVSIRFSLWQHWTELEKVSVTSEEIAFWQGWIRFILALEALSPPTNDILLMPLLAMTMPEQSPLGERGYTIGSQGLIRRIFLQMISQRSLPQEDFLRLYGRKVRR